MEDIRLKLHSIMQVLSSSVFTTKGKIFIKHPNPFLKIPLKIVCATREKTDYQEFVSFGLFPLINKRQLVL